MAHAVGAQVLVGVLQPALYIAVGLLHLRVWLAVGHVHRFIALVGQLGVSVSLAGAGSVCNGPWVAGPGIWRLVVSIEGSGPVGPGMGWLRVSVGGMGVSLKWMTGLPTRPS